MLECLHQLYSIKHCSFMYSVIITCNNFSNLQQNMFPEVLIPNFKFHNYIIFPLAFYVSVVNIYIKHCNCRAQLYYVDAKYCTSVLSTLIWEVLITICFHAYTGLVRSCTIIKCVTQFVVSKFSTMSSSQKQLW